MKGGGGEKNQKVRLRKSKFYHFGNLTAVFASKNIQKTRVSVASRAKMRVGEVLRLGEGHFWIHNRTYPHLCVQHNLPIYTAWVKEHIRQPPAPYTLAFGRN